MADLKVLLNPNGATEENHIHTKQSTANLPRSYLLQEQIVFATDHMTSSAHACDIDTACFSTFDFFDQRLHCFVFFLFKLCASVLKAQSHPCMAGFDFNSK